MLAAFTIMKSPRLRKLQTWTIIVLIAYTLLALFVYKFVAPNPARLKLEASTDRESQIQRQDVQLLRSNLSLAFVRLDALRHGKDEFQIIFFAATAGIVGFGIWSLHMMGRIKREALIDHAD